MITWPRGNWDPDYEKQDSFDFQGNSSRCVQGDRNWDLSEFVPVVMDDEKRDFYDLRSKERVFFSRVRGEVMISTKPSKDDVLLHLSDFELGYDDSELGRVVDRDSDGTELRAGEWIGDDAAFIYVIKGKDGKFQVTHDPRLLNDVQVDPAEFVMGWHVPIWFKRRPDHLVPDPVRNQASLLCNICGFTTTQEKVLKAHKKRAKNHKKRRFSRKDEEPVQKKRAKDDVDADNGGDVDNNWGCSVQ